MLDMFILYEIASRIDPNVMVRQDKALRAVLRRFITEYVVVKK